MTGLNPEGRTTRRTRRWRRLSSILSGSLAVIAVGGAVYLGATGPLVSPVQPAAPAAANAVDPAGAAAVPDFADRRAEKRDRGRGDALGFGRQR